MPSFRSDLSGRIGTLCDSLSVAVRLFHCNPDRSDIGFMEYFSEIIYAMLPTRTNIWGVSAQTDGVSTQYCVLACVYAKTHQFMLTYA